MTLSRQLILLIAGLVVVLFAGTLAIGIQNTRGYLESQLGSHAQDAATSLGLSATSHVDSGDQAMVTAMLNAMFHRGDYLKIRFENLDGEAWIERSTDLQLDDVPPWFQNMFALHPPERSATMMSGWRQVGKVVVISHPGLAYEQLWQTANQTFKLFLIGVSIAVLAGVIGLRLLLRPLKDVEAQAAAICNREFPVVKRRPFTLELRRVVEAMNRLSEKVSRLLAESEARAADMRRQAYQDPVTGLANRRQFMDVLEHRTGDRDVFGAGGLLLLQLREFKAFNQAYGYPAGDRLLAQTGNAMAAALADEPRSTLAHLAGADFAVLVENVDLPRLEALGEQIHAAVAALYSQLELPSPDVAHVGGAAFCGQDASALLADADRALRDAQRQGANAVVVHNCDDSDVPVRSSSEWRALIGDALTAGRFSLVRQAVFACRDRSELHHEVYLRMPDPDKPDDMIAAAVLLPLAESSGLAPAIDRAVIEAVMTGLEAGDYPGTVAVNLSPSSLVDDAMLTWVAETVARYPISRDRLILEFPEYGAAPHVQLLAAWAERLAPLGVRLSLDHFGKGFTAFAYLRKAKVDMLKIDGSFVRQLHQHEDNRFFLRSIAEIAHGLDMQVFAESVETEEDWQALNELGIDGGRGYWLSVPE